MVHVCVTFARLYNFLKKLFFSYTSSVALVHQQVSRFVSLAQVFTRFHNFSCPCICFFFRAFVTTFVSLAQGFTRFHSFSFPFTSFFVRDKFCLACTSFRGLSQLSPSVRKFQCRLVGEVNSIEGL